MDPVFVRRGGVLFVLKSPEDFISQLKAGKILPADRILVRDRQGVTWLPIEDIAQFRVETKNVEGSLAETSIVQPGDIFDHIRKPQFNIAALLLGGFWYRQRDMKRLGNQRLWWNVLICVGMMVGGIILGWPSISLLPLFGIGWFTSNLYGALRADHDLNRAQIAKFHTHTTQVGNSMSEVDGYATGFVDPQNSITTILREKIYN